MTEQEARDEAERRWPQVEGTHSTDDVAEGFVLGAAWERSRHSPRVVEAAPTDTDRGTFTASNGYKVDRLADGQTKITRATVGSFEHVTWCGGDEYLAIAEHALSRASQPVQVEVTEAPLIHHHARRGGKTETMIERMLSLADERGIKVKVLYPQNEVTDDMVERAARALGEFVTHGGVDDLSGPNGEYWIREARAVLSAALGGGPAPKAEAVQVEVTTEMVETAAEAMWDRWGHPGMFKHAPVHRQNSFRTDARAALSAALGGGDHAE